MGEAPEEPLQDIGALAIVERFADDGRGAVKANDTARITVDTNHEAVTKAVCKGEAPSAHCELRDTVVGMFTRIAKWVLVFSSFGLYHHADTPPSRVSLHAREDLPRKGDDYIRLGVIVVGVVVEGEGDLLSSAVAECEAIVPRKPFD